MNAKNQASVFLGVDVGGTKIYALLTDAEGKLLAEKKIATPQQGAVALAGHICQLRNQLCSEARCETGDIVGVGVGLPAAINPHTQELTLIPNINGMENVAFQPILQQQLQLPVVLENDVNVAALGEYRLGQSGNPFVFIALGTGIGMGSIVNGELCRGYRGEAGEIAYLPLRMQPYERAQYQQAVVEAQLGGEAWLARYHELSGEVSNITLAELFAQPNRIFTQVLQEKAGILVNVLLSIHAILNPERICFGGSIGMQAALLQQLRERIKTYLPKPPQLYASQLGQRAGAWGAAYLAMQQAQRAMMR